MLGSFFFFHVPLSFSAPHAFFFFFAIFAFLASCLFEQSFKEAHVACGRLLKTQTPAPHAAAVGADLVSTWVTTVRYSDVLLNQPAH